MSDIEHWIDGHSPELHSVAEHAGTSDEMVRFVALLVLGGLDDDDIYEQLRTTTPPSTDGQRSPLAAAPEVLGEVRRLVDAA